MPHTIAPISPLPGVVFQGESFSVPLQVYTGAIQREVRREGSAPVAQEDLTVPLSITYAIVLHIDDTVVRFDTDILPPTAIFTVPVDQSDTSTDIGQHDIILTLVYSDEVVVAAFSYQVTVNPTVGIETFPSTILDHVILYDGLELTGDIDDPLPTLGLGRSTRFLDQSTLSLQSTIVETSGKRGALFDGVDDNYVSDLNISLDYDIGHTFFVGFTAMDVTDGHLFQSGTVDFDDDSRMIYSASLDTIETAVSRGAGPTSLKTWVPPIVGQSTVYARVTNNSAPTHRLFIDGVEVTALTDINPGASFPGAISKPLWVGSRVGGALSYFMTLYAFYVYRRELTDAEIVSLSTHIQGLMP